ncbi:hypothetical protein I6E61_05985 [Psychrobacter sp. NZS113]|uniref:hypothetical protein n=1 Tax=Psychrobacter sp. NZS113 TaxID=2792045 RepID=UPI0018CDC758|nr:hypothetical protein [Psychrobacter sp. NZS113]MBH0095937.1 hypothetical protein [Psychrobacter sp. NZS113]
MEIKKIIIIAVILLLSIIGFNYYNSAQSARKIADRTSETEALRADLAQAENDKVKQAKIQQQQLEFEAMPEKAQQIIAAKESEPQPDIEYQNINFEKEDRAKLDEIMGRWTDASAIASRTSRIALPAVVKDMQSIKREVDKLSVTPCLTRAQANLMAAMESEITMYLKFMSDSKADISGDMMEVYKAQEQYYLIIKKCTD